MSGQSARYSSSVEGSILPSRSQSQSIFTKFTRIIGQSLRINRSSCNACSYRTIDHFRNRRGKISTVINNVVLCIASSVRIRIDEDGTFTSYHNHGMEALRSIVETDVFTWVRCAHSGKCSDIRIHRLKWLFHDWRIHNTECFHRSVRKRQVNSNDLGLRQYAKFHWSVIQF